MDDRFVEGIAEAMEIGHEEVTPDLELTRDNWNSLAIVSTIALVDELYDVMLSGPALGRCATLGDVMALIEKAKGNK